jgi:hypothetical protein
MDRIGQAITILDYLISKHFKYYESISELPGIGVIGLALRKKKNEI